MAFLEEAKLQVAGRDWGTGGEGDDRGWDGWMASPTQWTWVWVNSGSWWWTRRPGVLGFMGSQRVGHDWVTELNWTEHLIELVLANSLHFCITVKFLSSPNHMGWEDGHWTTCPAPPVGHLCSWLLNHLGKRESNLARNSPGWHVLKTTCLPLLFSLFPPGLIPLDCGGWDWRMMLKSHHSSSKTATQLKITGC